MPSPSPSLSRSPSPPEDIVATTMGFSSFGAKPHPPKKKRKLALDPNNHNNSDEASGSNNTPLGLRIRKSAGDAQQEKKKENMNFGVVVDSGEEEEDEDEDEEEQLGKEQQQSRQAMGQSRVHSDLNRGRGGQRARHQKLLAQRSGHDPLRQQTPASKAPDPLAAAARDESAALMLETGLLPRYLDWGEGLAAGEGGGVLDDGDGDDDDEDGGGGGRRERFEQEGRREDGEWDWQALRMGVRDQRGDVAFYDKSFVEDPWRGLGGGEGG